MWSGFCRSAQLNRELVDRHDEACGSMVLHDSIMFAFALYERKSEH